MGSPTPGNAHGLGSNHHNHNPNNTAHNAATTAGNLSETLYDPGLLNDANWHSDGMDSAMQFTFIPQGGDMM
jgi:hypothetical protein